MTLIKYIHWVALHLDTNNSMKLKITLVSIICSENASPEGFAMEVIETSVVVLTSAAASMESSSASSVNYCPYFTLDNVPNY